eukprot:6839798-Karenia_brevis.AAC.1
MSPTYSFLRGQMLGTGAWGYQLSYLRHPDIFCIGCASSPRRHGHMDKSEEHINHPMPWSTCPGP